MSLKVIDKTGRLPRNPTYWPDELKRAIAECCCGTSSDTPIVYYPWTCCGQNQPPFSMPSTVTVNIVGTLTHDGAYPVTHVNQNGWPDWYPSDAGTDPAFGSICSVPYVPDVTQYNVWVSELYQDFSQKAECIYHPYPFRCPTVTGTAAFSWEYFYFVQVVGNLPINNSQGCAISLGQFVRLRIRRQSAGGSIWFGGINYPDPNCPPFDTSTGEWLPLAGQGGSCMTMTTGAGSGCGQITCNPFKYKAGMANNRGLVASSIRSVICQDDGGASLDIVYEPLSHCIGGQASMPYAEIVL